MAGQKDENGLTPFQLVCSKLEEHLSKTAAVDTSPDKSGLPPSLVRFILFLHKECKSNPNEPVYKKANSTVTDEDSPQTSTNEVDMERNEDSQSSSSALSADEQQDRQAAKIKFLPIFKLISNRCVQLIESLVKQSNKDVEAINFNVYNSEGIYYII